MRPGNPIHPGEMLREEFLVPGKITQRAFAKRVGWTTARLNELIRGKRNVTADAALDLAAALGTTPELWLNLQMQFDLHRAKRRRREAS
jgi:addiction module HigA family antidote